MKKAQKFRIEKDSLGEVKVPKEALWGAQTQRALENFPISGIKFRFPFGRSFIKALGIIKFSAAAANQDLGLLTAKKQGLIQHQLLPIHLIMCYLLQMMMWITHLAMYI